MCPIMITWSEQLNSYMNHPKLSNYFISKEAPMSHTISFLCTGIFSLFIMELQWLEFLIMCTF